MTINERRRPVVAGVDYSSSSATAISYAAWEATRRGVGLRLVNGFVSATTGELRPGPHDDDNELLVAAEERLSEATADIRSRYPDLPLSTKVVAGSGGKTLVDESASAGLLVVGARGRGGFPGLLLGSVATQVTQHAHCPAIVVRTARRQGEDVPGRGPVVIGVDGSGSSADALGFGFDEASARGVPLVAVHVWSTATMWVRSLGTVWSPSPTRAQAQLENIARSVLSEAVSGWSDKYPQVTVERFTIHGDDPARPLLEVADNFDTDLIVVGSRERSGTPASVIGSVSQALVAHAQASVAVVRPIHAR